MQMTKLVARYVCAASRFRAVATGFSGLVLLCLLPSLASAQSTISGVVRDTSGAVIANAAVEAASDVLIEKTRSVTTIRAPQSSAPSSRS